MEKKRELKSQLLEIKSNDWEIPNDVDIRELALEAMDNIGVKDQELRDSLILTFLYKLITERKLSKDVIRELLNKCLSDKHLFYKIGEKKDDSVFNRGFTILIVRWIVYYHNKFGEDLLSKEEMIKVFEDVVKYVRLEKDVRGYVEDGGWAHSLAHAATALRTLALCNYIQKDELLELLEVVKEKASISYYVHITEEAERLVMVVINIMSRNILIEDEIIDWIRSFNELGEPSHSAEKFYWKENIQGLLRALYFRLKFKKGSIKIINEIEKISHKFNQFHNNMKE
ncbi:DUF2785 domain-containing protein [Wukongibacter baidiensis]|uniref:DUF2785 domain-containing protein n=1 Tax=Wukongibacter baidiensis TaxID=1723361 RepID=UPI003D7F890B